MDRESYHSAPLLAATALYVLALLIAPGGAVAFGGVALLVLAALLDGVWLSGPRR